MKQYKPSITSEVESYTPVYWLEKYSKVEEPIVCICFGCGRRLSIQEQLFSKYCIHHQPDKGLPDIADKLSDNVKSTNTQSQSGPDDAGQRPVGEPIRDP